MKKLKLVGKLVLLMIATATWGQTSVDVKNFHVMTYYSNLNTDLAVDTDSDELMVKIVLNFELVNVDTISSINIQAYDTLGGELNYSQLYNVVLNQGNYSIQQQGIIKEEIKGGKYIYFDMPLLSFRNAFKYGYFKIWVTDTQGVASQEKTFKL